jgi:hypothetical protein
MLYEGERPTIEELHAFIAEQGRHSGPGASLPTAASRDNHWE